MHIFNRIYYRRSNLSKWFGFTILPSLLPLLVTVFTALNGSAAPFHFDDYVKMTDVIFVGLSLSISNLNAGRGGIHPSIKDGVLITSMVSLAILGYFLGLHSQVGLTTATSVIASSFVLIPIAVSLEICLRKSSLNKRRRIGRQNAGVPQAFGS